MSRTGHHRGRGDAAQKWVSIAASIVVVFIVAWMTLESGTSGPFHRAASSEGDAGAAASARPAETAPATPAAPLTIDAGVADDPDAGLFLPTLSLGDAAVMPSGAPRSVKIGVVLVNFQGAEGAPPNARNKQEARAIADRLGQDARSDFHHAVTGGDPGSSDDVGRLPRGVLDPQTEVSVFALAVGEVSDVLETPRGYWVVKRIE